VSQNPGEAAVRRTRSRTLSRVSVSERGTDAREGEVTIGKEDGCRGVANDNKKLRNPFNTRLKQNRRVSPRGDTPGDTQKQ
jgi:hypothetical protein